jgi:LPXTG-motif cell wall-anchored protein
MRRFLVALAVGAIATLTLAAPAQAAAEDCAAYVNLCADFPGSADRDCPQIGHPVQLVNPANDPWRLDDDNDGVGCEVDATPTKKAPAKPKPSRSAAGGTTEGRLPVTGAPVGALVGAGAGVLVLGAGGVWLARRRRTRYVA